MPPRTYSREEAQAILARAVEKQHELGDQLTHDDLLAVGRELGVSSEAIEAAAATSGDELVVEREVRDRVAARRRGFVAHFVPFLVINVLLATINLMTGGPMWFVWAALGWGVGLAMHALTALAPDRAKIERKVRRRIERERELERKRLEREREQERRRARSGHVQDGARRVADAMQERAAEVLHAMADAIEGRPAEHVRVDGTSDGGARVDDGAHARAEEEHYAEPERDARRRSS